MKNIYVKTTDTCNLHCDHCFTSGRHGGKVVWDVENTRRWVEDFISQYPEDEEHHLELHGGEPFLVPLDKLESFTQHFEGRENISIGATSNLVFKLTDRHIAFIKNVLGSRIGTSWDGDIRFETETQKHLWMKNIKRLKEEGVVIKLFVSVTSTLVNRDVGDFLSILSEIEPDEVSLERLTRNGNANDNLHIFPDNEVQDGWYLKLYQEYNKRQWPFEISTLETIKEKIDQNIVKVDTNCRTCEQNLVTINADGSLGGCPNAAPEHSHATISESAKDFLASEGRVSEITKELDFHPLCLSCDVFDLCGGDCHRLAWQGDRCGGLKKLLRYVKYGNQISVVQL